MRPQFLFVSVLFLATACAPRSAPSGPRPDTPVIERGDTVVINIPRDTAALVVPAKVPESWWLLDRGTDGIYGASVERAYSELLRGMQPARQVIVAILDSGVDTAHADLRANLWLNPREVAGNGKDDDGNGYVDDMRGWDFIGGAGGKTIGKDTYEVTRLFARCEAGSPAPAGLTCNEIREAFQEKLAETDEQIGQIRQLQATLGQVLSILKRELATDSLTEEKVGAMRPTKQDVLQAQGIYMQLAANGITPQMVTDEAKRLAELKQYGLNPKFDPRAIVGDNYANPNERGYGNNDVVGPDAGHGTGVAGIVAALRDNGPGMQGIAGNVKIMVVRTVPDGDERDKDVANAIRYAVDNGAHIINMSFGKAFSPDKGVVDAAVKYADEKGVLLVHAAGNEGEDLDHARNYPNRNYVGGGMAKNWLEVGASGWRGLEGLAAEYSNYGKVQVDLFAPGSDIRSTAPGNEYEAASGTSFAAPVVTGVAALLMSYFPTLTASDVKRIILESATPLKDQMTTRPGADTSVRFGDLSATGAVINAYNAVKLAKQLAGVRT